MGNVLSVTVPALILPVDAYISDLRDFEFIQSTRFMKVAKVRCSDNNGDDQQGSAFVVLKVFVHVDPSFSLDPYRNQVLRVRDSLGSALNCSPFKKIIITDKCAILARQYDKETLYDRLSTRPFLTDIEKLWIAYQLLRAAQQCELADVCHGDIKSQNVLVSSGCWVRISDFASFKPAFLPCDNPSDFNFFFDTSRIRSCYLAPERFVSIRNSNNNERMASTSPPTTNIVPLPDDCYCNSSNQLTHVMDIFSLGCVFIELFADGQLPFTFAQLLAYRESKCPDEHIDRCLHLLPIDISSGIRLIIGDMLQRDPTRRSTASTLLAVDGVFPKLFDSFIYDYMKIFASQPILDSDERLEKLVHDEALLWNKLADSNGHLCESGVLLISLVLSTVRSLRFLSSKQAAIGLMCRLAAGASESIVADRIIPYMVHFLNDPYPLVRSDAVYAVTSLLGAFREIPKDDARIFADYLFPRLVSVHLDKSMIVVCQMTVVNDSSSIVRIALARNVGDLAETSRRFLHTAYLAQQQHPNAIDTEMGDGGAIESRESLMLNELKALHESMQEIVVSLLCDVDNSVRRAVVGDRESLQKLCTFFGKQKTSDVLLSHMITFLNDKTDWRIRSTFFEFATVPAEHIGWQSTLILKPLLQQGLRDSEECVLFATLACICTLCERNLLPKHAIYELLNDVVPFAAHPNELLRVATVGILSALDETLNFADMHCKVIPLVKPYLIQPLLKLDRKPVIVRCLSTPIPRDVWDMVIQSPIMTQLMEYIGERKMMIDLSGGGSNSHQLFYTSPPKPQRDIELLYQKLVNRGLDNECETKLLAFRDILNKMRTTSSSNVTTTNDDDESITIVPGIISLDRNTNGGRAVIRRHADLSNRARHRMHDARRRLVHRDNTGQQHDASVGGDPLMNPEWKAMFGGDSTPIRPPAPPSTINVPPQLLDRVESIQIGNDVAIMPDDAGMDMLETLTIGQSDASNTTMVNSDSISQTDPTIDTNPMVDSIVRMSSCRQALAALIERKRDQYSRMAPEIDGGAPVDDNRSNIIHQQQLDGRLVANLCEHTDAVNRLASHPVCRWIFASAGADGTVKLWSGRRIEGHASVMRSEATYTNTGDRVRSVAFLDRGAQLVCAVDNGTIHLIDVNTFQRTRVPIALDSSAGFALDLATWSNGFRSTILAVSHHGRIVCYDTRQPVGCCWSAQIASTDGLVTAFCVEPACQHWLCATTTAGRILVWDLRFQMQVNSCEHPNKCKMMRVWSAPVDRDKIDESSSSKVWASAAGNGELALWDLETATRCSVIWPTSAPPLSYDAKSSKLTTTAMTTIDDSGRYYTGDTEGTIRCWNPSSPKDCWYMSGADERSSTSSGQQQSSVPTRRTRFYKSQTIDAVHVLTESTPTSSSSSSGVRSSRTAGMATGSPLDVQVTTWHRDTVSDMIAMQTDQLNFLVSSSRDGVIKVWR